MAILLNDINRYYKNWRSAPLINVGALKGAARQALYYASADIPDLRQAQIRLREITLKLFEDLYGNDPAFDDEPKLVWYVALMQSYANYHEEALEIIDALLKMPLEEQYNAPERHKLLHKKDRILGLLESERGYFPSFKDNSDEEMEEFEVVNIPVQKLCRVWPRLPGLYLHSLARDANIVFKGISDEDKHALLNLAQTLASLKSKTDNILKHRPGLVDNANKIIAAAKSYELQLNR